MTINYTPNLPAASHNEDLAENENPDNSTPQEAPGHNPSEMDPTNNNPNRSRTREAGPLDLETLEILEKRLGPSDSIPTKFAYLSLIDPAHFFPNQNPITPKNPSLKQRARLRPHFTSENTNLLFSEPTNPNEAREAAPMPPRSP